MEQAIVIVKEWYNKGMHLAELAICLQTYLSQNTPHSAHTHIKLNMGIGSLSGGLM